MRYDGVVAFDLETEGFKLGRDLVLEIGAFVWKPNGEKIPFTVLIQTKNIITPEITKLTGIDSDILDMCGVNRKEAFCMFSQFVAKHCKKPLYVGHNIQNFDLPRINLELKNYRLPTLSAKATWDTLLQMRATIARKKKPTFAHTQKLASTYRTKEKCNLGAALEFYKLKRTGKAHTAASDASATLDIFIKQLARSGWKLLEGQK